RGGRGWRLPLAIRGERSLGKDALETLAPRRRDVARDLGREAAVFLGAVEDPPLIRRELLEVLAKIGIERRHLEERPRSALGLEREPAHRLVRVGMTVLREEDVERLGRDRTARHREVSLESIAVDAHA